MPPQQKRNVDQSTFLIIFGASLKIRTPGLLVRSQTLYPAELMTLNSNFNLPI